MIKNIFIYIAICTIISGCTNGPGGYFKKSSNNKIYDRKSFHDSKRAPLYNKKYINKAKHNVLNGEDDDFDDEYDDEQLYSPVNISRVNRDMYREMVEEDMDNNRGKNSRKKTSKNNYPSMKESYNRMESDQYADSIELKEELDQIKTMLYETKKDMASHKCPTAKTINSLHETAQNAKSKKQDNGQNLDNIKSI